MAIRRIGTDLGESEAAPGVGQVPETGLTAGQQEYDAAKAKEDADFEAWNAKREAALAAMSDQPVAASGLSGDLANDPDFKAFSEVWNAISAGAKSKEQRMRSGYHAIGQSAKVGVGLRPLGSKAPDRAGYRAMGAESGGISRWIEGGAYDQARRRVSGAVNVGIGPRAKPETPAAYGPSWYANNTAKGKGIQSPESGINMNDETRKRYGIKPII